MQTQKNMICICCPKGCGLVVEKSGEEFVITGNKCLRGKKYAIEEITAPKRTVTSTVKILGGLHPVISVKTSAPVLKEKVFTIMDILANVTARAPVNVGDVIVENVADTGVNVVATKSAKQEV